MIIFFAEFQGQVFLSLKMPESDSQAPALRMSRGRADCRRTPGGLLCLPRQPAGGGEEHNGPEVDACHSRVDGADRWIGRGRPSARGLRSEDAGPAGGQRPRQGQALDALRGGRRPPGGDPLRRDGGLDPAVQRGRGQPDRRQRRRGPAGQSLAPAPSLRRRPGRRP